MPRSARPYSARRYTGSRATVASGIPLDGPLISGGITLLCIAAALLGLSSWFGLLGFGLPVLAGHEEPASADVVPRYVNPRYAFVHGFTKSPTGRPRPGPHPGWPGHGEAPRAARRRASLTRQKSTCT